jgi:hypothetical protein
MWVASEVQVHLVLVLRQLRVLSDQPDRVWAHFKVELQLEQEPEALQVQDRAAVSVAVELVLVQLPRAEWGAASEAGQDLIQDLV